MDAFSKLMNLGHQVRGKVFNMDNKLEWIKSLLTMKMYDVELKEEVITYMKSMRKSNYIVFILYCIKSKNFKIIVMVGMM